MTATLMHKWGQPGPCGSAWSAELDGRYIVEVQAMGGSTATLCIFDHSDGDKLIHEESAIITHDPRYGADVADVEVWSARGIEIIDGLKSPVPK